LYRPTCRWPLTPQPPVPAPTHTRCVLTRCRPTPPPNCHQHGDQRTPPNGLGAPTVPAQTRAVHPAGRHPSRGCTARPKFGNNRPTRPDGNRPTRSPWYVTTTTTQHQTLRFSALPACAEQTVAAHSPHMAHPRFWGRPPGPGLGQNAPPPTLHPTTTPTPEPVDTPLPPAPTQRNGTRGTTETQKGTTQPPPPPACVSTNFCRATLPPWRPACLQFPGLFPTRNEHVPRLASATQH